MGVIHLSNHIGRFKKDFTSSFAMVYAVEIPLPNVTQVCLNTMTTAEFEIWNHKRPPYGSYTMSTLLEVIVEDIEYAALT